MILQNFSSDYRSLIRWFFLSIFIFGIFFWTGSSYADDLIGFQRLLPEDYPPFEDDLNYDRLADSIQGSIDYFGKQSTQTTISFGEDQYSPRHLAQSLQDFLALIRRHPSADELSEYILKNFYVYAGVQAQKPVEVLFTGYYEPMMDGSRTQSSQFKYPIYGRPSDLMTFNLADFSCNCPSEKAIGRYAGGSIVPYYSRQEIDKSNVLQGKAQTIAWVDDPVDLFFLHVQGSGKICLENHDIINVHYLISNGHPYQSIGKYLIDKGRLAKEEVSMQSIRSYLRAHPDEMNETFNYNPRYVFFEEVDAGPIGCFNIELTPGRSIALDRKQYPAAALAFIQAQKPVASDDGSIEKWTDFSRFVMNQDTGGAIAGPARADIFWGNDEYAELAAGYMKHPGRLYFLVLKPFSM
jgi:membrane-bound lytic murein transglycosylase A